MNDQPVAVEAFDARIMITTQGEMILIQGSAGLERADIKLILEAALEAVKDDVDNECEISMH